MEADDLEAAVEDAIRQCDGDLRATVRALLVMIEYWQARTARLAEAVSPGYLRAEMVDNDDARKAG